MDQYKIYNSIHKHIELCNTEEVSVLEAVGRVNATEIKAKMDIPNFSRTNYDGFAIHQKDYAQLLKGDSITLKIIAGIGAGHFINKSLYPSTTFYLMTGTEIPKGTQYVVPHESAEIVGDEIIINKINPQLRTIAYQGHKHKKGEIVVDANILIDRKIIFDITNQGYDRINVYKSPKVAIVSTGDEIKEIGTPHERGTIYNSTSYAIAADVMKHGGHVIGIDHVSDEIFTIIDKITNWHQEADIIITTGGIAKGKYDYTKNIHDHLSTNILYAEMDKTPRIIISKLKNKWIINLSGSPKATFVSLDCVIVPILRKMMGLNFIQ